MSTRYRPNVRIGNWFEEICLEQEKSRQFKNQRETGRLLVDKTRKLFDNFHNEIQLEAPKESIRYGAIVQLMPVNMNVCDSPVPNIRPALSVVINEQVVRNSQNVTDQCELTVAATDRTLVRNSFRIISGEERHASEVLQYAEPFRLECVGTDDSLMLYTTSKSPNLHHAIESTYESYKNGEINLPLGLIFKKDIGAGKAIPSACVNWYCQHIDPGRRFENEFTPVPSNSPVIITHRVTNRNLAAENIVIQTIFGPEYLVSVQNYNDIFGRPKWNNTWMICNGRKL